MRELLDHSAANDSESLLDTHDPVVYDLESATVYRSMPAQLAIAAVILASMLALSHAVLLHMPCHQECHVRIDYLILACIGTLEGLLVIILIVGMTEIYHHTYSNTIYDYCSRGMVILSPYGILVFVAMIFYQVSCYRSSSTWQLIFYWLSALLMCIPSVIAGLFIVYVVSDHFKFESHNRTKREKQAELKFMHEFDTHIHRGDTSSDIFTISSNAIRNGGGNSLVIAMHMLYYRYRRSYRNMMPVTVVPIDHLSTDRHEHDNNRPFRHPIEDGINTRYDPHPLAKLGSANIYRNPDAENIYVEGVCYLCEETFKPYTMIMQYPGCYHEYHSDCLVPFILGTGNCPRCGLYFYQAMTNEINLEASRKA